MYLPEKRKGRGSRFVFPRSTKLRGSSAHHDRPPNYIYVANDVFSACVASAQYTKTAIAPVNAHDVQGLTPPGHGRLYTPETVELSQNGFSGDFHVRHPYARRQPRA